MTEILTVYLQLKFFWILYFVISSASYTASPCFCISVIMFNSLSFNLQLLYYLLTNDIHLCLEQWLDALRSSHDCNHCTVYSQTVATSGLATRSSLYAFFIAVAVSGKFPGWADACRDNSAVKFINTLQACGQQCCRCTGLKRFS